MTAIDIAATRVRARTHQPSLAQELRRHGIPILDRTLVEAHKRWYAETYRSGWNGVAFWVINAVRLAFAIASLAIIPIVIDRENPERSGWASLSWLFAVVALALVGGIWSGTHGHYEPWTLVPLLAGLCAAGIEGARTIESGAWFERVSSYWITQRIGNRTDRLLGAPGFLYQRIADAKQIPGVDLRIERLGDDPFVQVVRWSWRGRECHYIGAFATGDPMLDNF